MGKYGKHRPLVRIAALLLALSPAVAQATCRQALSLGLDVSGSVDGAEYALQINGLANALLAEEVQQAFLAIPGAPVRLHIYIWAGAGGPRELLPWTEIGDAEDLLNVAEALHTTYHYRFSAETSLGLAMLYGGKALQEQAECWRLTLDISGDGKSNTGPEPRAVANTASLANVTINGLVVGQYRLHGPELAPVRLAALADYYQSDVIRGSEAFVEQATDFSDFERAMTRKLLKELQTLAIGAVDPGDR